jgi:hypothetical protein
MKKLSAVLLVAVLAILFIGAEAGRCSTITVKLAWDPSVSPEVVGYKIYYGLSSRTYSWYVNAGNSLEQIVYDLENGTIYYITAVGYDINGNESDFSNELEYGTSNLHRFRNMQNNAYLFTINQTEVDNIHANWLWLFADEGLAFYVYANQYTESILPVHRFRNMQNNAYFFTINQAEVDNIHANWLWLFADEGVAFYACEESYYSSTPVRRFRNAQNNAYLFTINQAEINYIYANFQWLFVDEGIAFYAFQ